MKKLRVAAYCRVSTKKEIQAHSERAQVKHYEEMIAGHPDWELAGIYVDSGKSAASMDNRPALQKLLSEARAGRIDRILTKSISRFSRNLTDTITVVREMREHGVSICFEKEGIDTGDAKTELILGIFASFAEEESRSISENCKWGIRERFRRGTYLPAVLPYGYRKNGANAEPDPETANVVLRIFEAAAAGISPTVIAKTLVREGRPSPRGGKWTANTVKAIVRNEFYTGALLLQKTYRGEDRRQRGNDGRLDRYLIRDHHRAIISEELFGKAQR